MKHVYANMTKFYSSLGVESLMKSIGKCCPGSTNASRVLSKIPDLCRTKVVLFFLSPKVESFVGKHKSVEIVLI